jgi:ABC-type transport system involved in multi-copper enzyme maturation permease subunit
MINFANVWAVARAEMRLTRRLVRFWIFTIIAALFALLAFVNFFFIHWAFSFVSASAASAYPRFFMGAFGSNFVFFVLVALIFLGFDLRARDTRERMVEVLDSLPYTNTELVVGKFLGILIPCWVAVLVIAGILATLAASLDTAIEPWSVVGFIFLQSLPGYAFFLGLVFLLSSLLRHRLIVAFATMVLLVLVWAAGRWWIPLYGFPLIDVTGGYSMPFPSDIIPFIIERAGLVQRIGYLLAGFGLLGLAAATHPRKDDGSRVSRAAVAGVLVAVGMGLCAFQVLQAKGSIDRRASWKQVHERQSTDPAPDLLATSGTVRIDPGRPLEMDLSLRFRPRGETALDEAVFTLNPALAVGTVTDDAGRSLEHTHEEGLLAIRLADALAPGEERTVNLTIAGSLHPDFAYLDSAFEPFERKGADGALLLLGYYPSINDDRFVALLPGARWLPASGSDVGRADPTVRPADFYDIDLTVELPEGWLVAGPGRRQEATGAEAGRARFRFAPGAPVPDVALVAARYESRSTEIEGVTLEMLVHPAHAACFEEFEDAAGALADWLEEKLTEAAEVGLGYPYDALTMVEVPNSLRGYGGGWRMDSTLIQPAMILMRESGFPTARFKRGWRNPEQYEDREDGLPGRKREVLEAFFENDMNGGNPFIAAARSFFGFQTAGEGPAGVPLDFVFENLSSRLVTEHRGYFSYRIFDRSFGQDFQLAGQAMGNPDRVGETYTDVLIHRLTSRPEVWEAVLDASLVEMDPWEDPERTIDVLMLKGGAMAQSMLDDLGREKTGQFLAALRSENAGDTFTREDILTTGQSVEEDLDWWMDTWLDRTDLPGFTVGDVRVHRLEDGDDGTPRYQSIVTVYNGEDVPGLLKVEYREGQGYSDADRGATDPVRVEARSAVEIGLITSETPTALRVAPYLALNRDPFSLPLPTVDEEKTVDDEPFTGSRGVEWEPVREGIVVDDLDDRFSVEETGDREMLRVAGRGGDETLDQGLPVSPSLRATRWSRMAATTAHGKYRHTMAVIRAGEGDRRAVFTAELPASGPWELDYFFARPGSRSAARLDLGTWNLTLVDESGSQEITFDAGGGESGWNALGTFEVAEGEVKLMVSNRTDGDYVVADAIRWKRPRGSGQVAAP